MDANTLLSSIALGVAGAGALGLAAKGSAKAKKSTLHGSARWAARRDLKRAALLGNDGVYVGAWKDGRTVRYLRHNGPEHVLCYAPTRSGKGVSLVIPTLLSWQESAFVLDLKGELWALTAGWRQQYGKNKALRFEPAAAEGSCCFNPLDEIRLGTQYETGDAQNIAMIIIDPHGKGLNNFWDRTAQTVISGCILHLCLKAKAGGPPATLPELDGMLADPNRDINALWEEMVAHAHPLVAKAGREMLNRKNSPTEASGILSTAQACLGSLFRDPVVARNTSRSDFRIADLMHHETPVSLYVLTEVADKDRLRPLVRLLVNLMLRRLSTGLAFERGMRKPTYKHRLLMMLDEFPSLGKLDLMQESLAFVAGYGIKCYLICQDINQLHQHYGKEETITSNCHIQCAFAPNRLETAEHLSRLTGETTVVTEEVSRAGRGLSVTVTRSMKPHARRLLTPDECIRLPGPLKDGDRITESGDMIVYAAGCPAIRGRQPLYFQDPVFAARAALPPPAQSDVLLYPELGTPPDPAPPGAPGVDGADLLEVEA